MPMNYDVQVTFWPKGDGTYYVTADPYPVPGEPWYYLRDGNSVTWKTDDAVDLQVGFELAYNLRETSDKRHTGPMGPFESVSHPPGQRNVFVGKLSDKDDVYNAYWRYVCIFFRNGERTPWKPGAAGADDSGVDDHRPPPMLAETPGEGPAGEP